MSRSRSIFISYRRRHSIDITGRIYDRLVAHFGEESIFKDVDAIPSGVNYRHHLEQAVSHCPVLLAIIDPHWLGITDDQGRPRLANPADWVRIEIETALQRDRLVIPILVGEAKLPSEADLPESLKALAYRQSAKVRCDPDFHRDVDRLIHRIEEVFSSLAAGGAAQLPASASLIDELAAALAIANKPPQTAPMRVGRRRWLRLMGLGIMSGGAVLAVRQRVPALQDFAIEDIATSLPDLSTLPTRLKSSLEDIEAIAPAPDLAEPDPAPEDEARLYTYESVTLDEYGKELAQGRFTTPAYGELPLAGPDGPVPLSLVSILGGQFVLGAPDTELGHDPAQPPQTVAKVESFWLGAYPITQAQWRTVAMLAAVNRPLDPSPAHFTGDSLPVEQVSWHEAVEFCDRLNRWIELNPASFNIRRFRLPTETEWEYACRAKTTTPFHTGQTLTTELANYDGTQPYRQEPIGQRRGATTPVGSFGKANDFGIYDMHGNVLEWCVPGEGLTVRSDWRVVRGGSWQSQPRDCRSAYRAGFKRDTRSNQIGFRVVAEGV